MYYNWTIHWIVGNYPVYYPIIHCILYIIIHIITIYGMDDTHPYIIFIHMY